MAEFRYFVPRLIPGTSPGMTGWGRRRMGHRKGPLVLYHYFTPTDHQLTVHNAPS